MNHNADVGAIPAKVSVKTRATVTAGFAKLVDDVNQYAAPMYAPTVGATHTPRPVLTMAHVYPMARIYEGSRYFVHPSQRQQITEEVRE